MQLPISSVKKSSTQLVKSLKDLAIASKSWLKKLTRNWPMQRNTLTCFFFKKKNHEVCDLWNRLQVDHTRAVPTAEKNPLGLVNRV